MTIQELYAQIGGNYEQAQRVMKMDKLSTAMCANSRAAAPTTR